MTFSECREVNQKPGNTFELEKKLIRIIYAFYRLCFNQQNEFIVLWILCQRGSLEDVLFNDELKISRNFQVSFAKDVVKVKQSHFL
jgi:hypothetical protein